MSCACEKGAEVCDNESCGRTPHGDAGSWARLMRLRLCEPFCNNGGCLPASSPVPGWDPNNPNAGCPPGYVRDPFTGACVQNNRATAITEMNLGELLRELVRRGQLEVCRVDDGPGVRLPTEVDATGKPLPPFQCVTYGSCGDPCMEFGPHFNCERRSSDLSPSQVESIMKTYAEETATTTAGTAHAVPGATTGFWYYVSLGALGVSHTFCLEAISGVTTGAAAIPIVNAGVGGERIACSAASPGQYAHVGESPAKARPGDIEITANRCACKNLCASTPARGAEFYYFQTAAELSAADVAAAVVTLTVTRKCWLKCIDRCVPPLGSQVLITDTATTGVIAAAPRNTTGVIPFV